MKKEHPDTDHIWACRQFGGVAGEITTFTFLSADQVDGIKADPSRIDEACPEGDVVCNTCEIPLLEGSPNKVPPPIDFNVIRNQLVRPGSVIPQEPQSNLKS